MGTNAKVTQIGLDVHRKFSIASARDASGRVVQRERLEHVDRNELRKRLSRWPRGTPVILEGTFGWGWMSDELLAANHDPHLASSGKVAGWRKARGLPKSNKRDADLLSELWYEKPTIQGGVLRRWWEVWLAPQEVRDQRELLRHRMGMVRNQTIVKNRIHAILHRHGIIPLRDAGSGREFADLFGVGGRRFLSLLMQDEQKLRETARRTLKDQLILLDTVRRLIARATSLFRLTIKRNEMARRLTSLPGVSVVLGYTIAAEIGRIERFRNGWHLASYSLLAPIADDSGEDDESAPIGRHIGHTGCKTLQWAFIEAAHGAVIKDARFRAIFNRRTDNGKKDRQRGYISVANAMCKIACSMLKNGTDYQETPPCRPGSERGNKLDLTSASSVEPSRPGTGQPLAAMAAAIACAGPLQASL
jgi:transposase